jgi:hypothetical protein
MGKRSAAVELFLGDMVSGIASHISLGLGDGVIPSDERSF